MGWRRRDVGYALGALGLAAGPACGAAGGSPAPPGAAAPPATKTSGPASSSTPSAGTSAAATVGKPLLVDVDQIAAVRTAAAGAAGEVGPGVAALRQAADKALSGGPWTVSDKAAPPAGGDKHDYVTLSIYWWPDPAKPNGLPYVNKDGQTNPESNDPKKYDKAALGKMVDAVETGALAYAVTGTASYAERAARQLRAWFLDPATRMSPHMRFAQLIPGRTEERGTGIIESRVFIQVADAAALLAGSAAWPAADHAALQAWYGQMLDWLLESAQGKMEARARNNHGLWYDAQVVACALFAGRGDVAARTLSESVPRRIAAQIEPDGRQPEEVTRTRSYHYSIFALQALLELAALGQRASNVGGVDLWHYATPDGRSARQALDYLLPYAGLAGSGAKWPYDEIRQVDFFDELGPLLAAAARAWPDGPYASALATLSAGQKPLSLLKLRLGVWGAG